jgi:predicted ribosome quality control (RQC) complex YloA/Tae2 family protein
LHNTYFFIRQISARLSRILPGKRIISCFSQSKNEMILEFDSEIPFIIRATFNPDFSSLSFPDQFFRSRKNSVDLFGELMGRKVINIRQFLHERSFLLEFESNYSLLFKLHGNLSNLILFEGNQIKALFRNNLKNDLNISLPELDNHLDPSLTDYLASRMSPRNIYPVFDKHILNYLEYNQLFEKEPALQFEFIQETIEKLNNPSHFFLAWQDEKPVLSLLKLYNINATFDDPLHAANEFQAQFSRIHYLLKEKNEVLSRLNQQKARGGNYLVKLKSKQKQLAEESRYEETANLIMANLHQIPTGSTEVELYDFYHDKLVKIRLKRDWTPQKSAENLYRKAKNQKIEINKIRDNISQKEMELLQIESYLSQIDEIDNLKTLRQFVAEHKLNKTKETEQEFPFIEFLFQGFRILIGRNAANNDLLTQKYAHKNDLWLHARDVPGSHVVIQQNPGQDFPATVIERAAELAAYFSKRKQDTLCPVQYTTKKYVRKRKGAAPGEVILEREKVILVPPKK